LKLEELIAEGERLSRPRLLLGAAPNGPCVGYWGGERVDEPNSVPSYAHAIQSIQHIFTIDTRILEGLDLPVRPEPVGLFRYVDVKDRVSNRILQRPMAFEEVSCSGKPLYATRASSFPPFAALCLHGGSGIAAWLDQLGLKRHEYEAAEATPVAREYVEEYALRSVRREREALMALGGWHIFWPEDDFYAPMEMRLAAMTLPNALPQTWIEVWLALGRRNWSVRERIDD